MKKSSNVLLSAVFMTTAASFMADKAKAQQQNISDMPAISSGQNQERDSTSHHNTYNNVPAHRGFFSRLFHHNPKPTTNTNNNIVNDGPRRTAQTMDAVAGAPKSSGGFGSTGSGSAHT